MGLHKISSICLSEQRVVQRFTTVPALDDLRGRWEPDKIERYVGIPLAPGFTGIDSALARTRLVGFFKTKRFEIFFIQSTVSTPQEHGIKTSPDHTDLVALFQSTTGIITPKKTRRFVIFLTPKRGTGTTTTNMEYNNCSHSFFQKIVGEKSSVSREPSNLTRARVVLYL